MNGLARSAAIALLMTASAFASPAWATVLTEAGGSVAVFCAPTAPAAECSGGFWQRGAVDRGAGTSRYSDELDISYSGFTGGPTAVPGFRDRGIASATASPGSLRATAITSSIAPIGAAAAGSAGASAAARFEDRLHVTGRRDALTTIELHYALSGNVSGPGIILLPGGLSTRSLNDDATGSFNVSHVVRKADGDLFPFARPPANGTLSRQLLNRLPSDSISNLTFFLDVAGGNEIDILAILQVSAASNGVADFGSTAILEEIVVPSDIGLFADSGELFQDGGRYLYRSVAAIEPPPPPPPPPPLDSTVPEPASALLLLGASVGLLLRRRHG